jgi:ribosomal protein S6
MSEATMPATEAVVEPALEEVERQSYELAFHILPTVAEGEVGRAFEEIKSSILKAHGEFFGEEAPERFELAYKVFAHLEGKNRPYTSAYFGWVRFRVAPSAIDALTREVEGNKNILRYLLIKLTKVEEAHPFKFHEVLKSQKKVLTIEEEDLLDDGVVKGEDADAEEAEVKEEVDDAELDRALEKPEV